MSSLNYIQFFFPDNDNNADQNCILFLSVCHTHEIEIHKSNRILLRYRKIYYSAIRLVNYNVLLLDIYEKLNSCELPANDAIYARKK